jgi:amino acid adenylation domain-containing protein/thioester reductase-like protein
MHSISFEDCCIHQLIEYQAQQTPDAVAIAFQNQQLTYQELNQRSNQLAHYLKNRGVQPETLVGVCLDRSFDLFIGLLGVLKAGGAYIPLDYTYPRDRLEFMMADSQLPVLLTQQHLLSEIPIPEGMRVICLDTDWPTIAQSPTEQCGSEVTPGNLAYIIYTSGSTGKPKGVQIEHGSVVNLLQSMQQEPGITPQDTLLAITTFAFDMSVPDLYLPLTVGAQIKLIEREITSDAARLAEVLSDPSVTFVQATPATWQLVLAAGWQGNPHLKILCGGEALPRSLANQLLRRVKSLWHMYGPTETTVWSMVYPVETNDCSIPLGHAIANTQIYLLQEPARRKDDSLLPVPVGEIGEIYIGGHGVARGYLNRPELNYERFVADPFSDAPTARLYKTGDLARYAPNGTLEFIGRTDYQVKIRGFRVELGDIEAALLKHTAIQNTVVVTREDTPGDRRLVAYVVLKSDALELRATELRSWLRTQIPNYMIPSIIVFMDALPLTPNCKVDRRALPLPTIHKQEEIVSPRTRLEQELTQIWISVLGIDVGIYQNFFESGGDSLRTALLIARIRETFQLDLSLDCLFKAPTVAELAELIEETQSSGSLADFETAPEELWSDAILDEAIYPATASNLARQHIFLTGATGFVGAFLLRKLLLQDPHVTVYCLVRANRLEDASQRLRKSLEGYEIWQDAFGNRIIPILGDLSEPWLGLSQSGFNELANQIDTIYHCGAYVNLVYPYIALRKANVEGTREILRLATQGRTKPVHYISTLDVFQSSQYDEKELILETEELLSCEGYSEGYAQSKWVAERLMLAARDRGLPVCIYRLGMVVGHSQTGGFQVSNMICRMIKSFIQLEYAPELDLEMSLAPVDYVTQAIEYLSQQSDSFNKTFHILSPHVLTINQLVSGLNALGYPVSCMPYKQWQTKLLTMPPDNALTPMVPLLTKGLLTQQKTVLETATFASQIFDTSNTQHGLMGSAITCPPINMTTLKVYLDYLIRNGFLPQQPQLTSTI